MPLIMGLLMGYGALSAAGGDNDPDEGGGLWKLLGFALLFFVVWGTLLYLLARIRFFEQVGKAFRDVLDAIGIGGLLRGVGDLFTRSLKVSL